MLLYIAIVNILQTCLKWTPSIGDAALNASILYKETYAYILLTILVNKNIVFDQESIKPLLADHAVEIHLEVK